MLRQKNTKKQGNIGLGAAVAHFTSIGVTVSLPLNDSQRYDMIADIDNRLNRVSVKTTYRKRQSTFTVQLCQKGGSSKTKLTRPFDPTSIELLFVLCEDGSRYLIPASEIRVTHELSLGAKLAQYKIGASGGS